jgi:hypothetical protein
MNVLIGLVCGAAALGLFLGLAHDLLLWVHRDGFKQGYQEGLSDAQKFSELWWNVAEQQIDEARQEIWRTEPGEKKWP